MREQVELTFLIGYDREATPYAMAPAFERDVIQRACELCGGCTVVRSDGYWMSDAAQHKQTGASHVRIAKALRQGRQFGRLARQFQPEFAPFFPGGSPYEL